MKTSRVSGEEAENKRVHEIEVERILILMQIFKIVFVLMFFPKYYDPVRLKQ